jgi:hypothetical protein
MNLTIEDKNTRRQLRLGDPVIQIFFLALDFVVQYQLGYLPMHRYHPDETGRFFLATINCL